MGSMTIHNLRFQEFISEDQIRKEVSALAGRISEDYKDRIPCFLPILNGAFMFASDLLKEITLDCRVSFVKIASYQGTQSTGKIKTLIGHEESLFNQDIIIIEDIVDTGISLQRTIDELRELGTKSVEAVSLFRKFPARDKKIDVKYVGFDIENEFVVGYGLDYDGLGRNLNAIYTARE